jgi:hypothetical protein
MTQIPDPHAEEIEMASLAAAGWRPFEGCPKQRATHEFRFADGSMVVGELREYWCGSDCPCYGLDDGPDEMMNSYPECWGVTSQGNMLQTDPTHYRPCR